MPRHVNPIQMAGHLSNVHDIFSDIRDPTLRENIERVQILQHKLRDVKNTIREKRNELQVLKSRAHEALDDQRNALTHQIDELLAKRSQVHQKAISNKFREDNTVQLRDHLNLLDTEIAILRPRLRRVSEAYSALEIEAKAKENAVVALQSTKSSWKSKESMESELVRVDQNLSEATSKYQKTGNARFNEESKRLSRTRSEILQSINDCQRMKQLQANSADARHILEQKKKELDEIQSRLTTCISDRDASSKQLVQASASKNQSRTITEPSSDLSLYQIDRQVEVLKKKRIQLQKEHATTDLKTSLSAKDQKAFEEISEALNVLHGDQDSLNADLKGIQAMIHEVKVSCEKNVLQALINPHGNHLVHLKEIQATHDVQIQIGVLEGFIILRGIETSTTSASVALSNLLKEVADHQHVGSLQIDVQQAGDIIGPRGTVISSLQKNHNVSIDVHASTGLVEIKGTNEGVMKAKEAIVTLLESAYRQELVIPQHLLLPVLGRRVGPSLQEMQTAFGLKSLRLIQNTVVVVGSKEAVGKCCAELQNRMKKYEGNSTRVVVQEQMIPAVIGKGGVTIRKIESETNTIIDIQGTTIWMHGTAEDVKRAQERIREITNRDEVRIPLEATTVSLVTREFLRELKEQSNVDVQLVHHPECAIVARGSREALRNLKPMIDMKILKKKVNSRTVSFPPVLFNYLRGIKDSICTQYELEAILLDRSKYELVLHGRPSAPTTNVDDAMNELNGLIHAAETKIYAVKITPAVIPVIIGTRGQTIKSITTESAAEVQLDHAKLEVLIYGDDDAIRKATQRIQQILDSDSAKRPETHNVV